MSARLENKLKIVESIAALTTDKSLEEIRTVDICNHASLSRQTFYRNFDDKYDAAIWFVEEAVKASVRQIGLTLSWRTGIEMLFDFASRNRLFLQKLFAINIFDSNGSPLIVRALIENCVRHYEEQFEKCTGNEPDALVRFQIRAFTRLKVFTINEWLQTGVPELSDDFFDAFITVIPAELFKALDIADVTDAPCKPLLRF